MTNIEILDKIETELGIPLYDLYRRQLLPASVVAYRDIYKRYEEIRKQGTGKEVSTVITANEKKCSPRQVYRIRAIMTIDM